MPEYALTLSHNIRKYALIMLDMIEYVDMYFNKQSAEYVRILNVFDAVHSVRTNY